MNPALVAWPTAIGLLAISALLAAIARVERQAGRPFVRHWIGLSWLGVALALATAVMTTDAGVREPLTASVDSLADAGVFIEDPLYWTVLGTPPALALVLLYLPWLSYLPAGTRRPLVAAAVCALGGLYLSLSIDVFATSRPTPIGTLAAIATPIHGSAAALAVALVLHALLRYWRDTLGRRLWPRGTTATALHVTQRHPF